MIALGIVGIILVADTIVIMATLKRDERETLHEAIAERNAMWTMVFVLAGGLAYQVASSTIRHETPYVDPVILIALFSALAVKAITNYRLR
jgi:predicted Co/Zn/Cd cation transporter (cation efflux family)